jgi:pantothenate synthetase
MSSRNTLLSSSDRDRRQRVVYDVGAELDYLELVEPATMRPLVVLEDDALAVVAARLGAVRLIDNLAVPVPSAVRDTELAVATPMWAPTAE